LILPFIGGEHPFNPSDFEAIEMAAVLMGAEYEKKKKEQFIGIYKTYLPLWIISIDGQNGIMVEALILNSDNFQMRRFDKAVELDPGRDLSASSLDDFRSKLHHFDSRINAIQKEAKIELNGYLDPTIAGEIRVLFGYLDQRNVYDLMVMSQRLSQESAELMVNPIISAFHVDVRKILQDLYQVPILINTQLLELFQEFDNITRKYIDKVGDLEHNINNLQDGGTYKTQERITSNLLTELESFREAKDRSHKKVKSEWDEINHLNERIQFGYINLVNTIFKTKQRILELGAPFSEANRQGEAVSVLMPIYLAVFQEKNNRIAYFPPLILNFTKKKDLTRPKGLQSLKNQLEHKYSKKVPPGISEIDEHNLLFKPTTQQLFNDGVHSLRESKIIDSKTYVRIMDSYNEFFKKAQGPPKTRLS